jgi:hypothetical protein
MANFHEPAFGRAHAATNFERPSDGLFGPVFNTLAYSIWGSLLKQQDNWYWRQIKLAKLSYMKMKCIASFPWFYE